MDEMFAALYRHSLTWPKDWEEFLWRMKAAEEFHGKIVITPTDKNFIIVRCEHPQDQEILQACVALGSPPAF
jgi:hypothetical protein